MEQDTLEKDKLLQEIFYLDSLGNYLWLTLINFDEARLIYGNEFNAYVEEMENLKKKRNRLNNALTWQHARWN